MDAEVHIAYSAVTALAVATLTAQRQRFSTVTIPRAEVQRLLQSGGGNMIGGVLVAWDVGWRMDGTWEAGCVGSGTKQYK